VLNAAQAQSDGTQVALDGLLRRYQSAVLSYLVFKFCLSRPEAEDVWQCFVVSRILEKRFLAQADPQRGRFRTFLLSTLNHFVISELRRRNALKRSPGQDFVPLDALTDKESPCQVGPVEDDSEVVWARAVIAGALLNMHAACAQSGMADVWGVFDGRILTPLWKDEPPLAYGELVRRFGFKSPSQAANALITAKRMFKRQLHRVIAQYAADDWEVEEEVQALKRLLENSE
jgi:RNA polymerase sigma-70 factor (ECF subfamily)